MRLIKAKQIEGCLEGSNVKDILFDRAITKEFIDYLGNLGKLIYNDSFDKPFFRVIVRGKYTLKGAQGNKTIRVILPENVNGEMIEEIKLYTEKF